MHRHRLQHDPPARGRARRRPACARSSPCAASCAWSPGDGRRDPGRGGGRAGRDRGRARAPGPRARRARACASSAPRRSAARANRDELCAAVHRAAGVARRGPHRRAGGARWPSPGRWRRWPAPPAGRVGVVDVGGGSSRARDRHGRAAASTLVDVAADRLGRRWPTRHLRSDPPTRGRARRRCAPSRRRARGRRPARDRARPRRRRQRDVAARGRAAASWRRRTIARILAVLLARAGRRGRQAAAGSHVERVRLLPAGLLPSRRPGAPSAGAAADRPRRPARGRRPARHSTVVVEWMAAAWPRPRHPGLHADCSYREAAARTVAVRAQELFEHAEGVLDTTDIERVHDMRVATRRLRAVLEIFAPCFPRKALRDVLRDVKALADALGARRDPDVHLAAARGVRRARSRTPTARASRSSPSACAPSRARATRCSPPRWPARADRPARPPRRAERGRLARARPATVVRPAAAAGPAVERRPREGARGQGPRPRRRRWPTTSSASSPRPPGRAVLVHPARRSTPREVEGAARHAHRRQAPALHPRGRRRAVLRPVRRDGDQAHQGAAGPARRDPRLRRPAPARARAAGRAARRRRARGPRRAPATPPDLDPTLAVGHAARARPGAAWRRSRIYVEARRGLLFERFLELWRDLEREGFRARLEYAITERPRARPTPPSPSDNGDRAVAPP